MSIFKCVCGNKDCKIELRIYEGEIWLQDKKGNECLMYADANTFCEMIKDLKLNLLKMTQIEVNSSDKY